MAEKKRYTIKALKERLGLKPTIEKQADLETTKYATKDFAEKLIREKVEDAIKLSHFVTEGKIEDAIKVLRSDMEGKLEESTNKLYNKFDEKIKLNSDDILSNLRAEYRKQTEDLLNTIKSTSPIKRINIYVIGISSAFVIIIALLSFLGYKNIKSTAKDTAMATIESQADLETTKYVTMDFAEKLIREKVEDIINVSLSDIEGKLEENTNKLFNALDKRIKLKSDGILSNLRAEHKEQTEDLPNTIKNNESSKGAATNKQAQVTPEKTLGKLMEYNDVLTQKKTEKQYAFESRHKKGFNGFSNTNDPSAITFLNVQIRLNPENQYAYRNRGDTYYNLKQYKKAIDDYNKTIELDPENVIAYGRRGDAYVGLKQYGKAIIDYDKAVDLDPGYAPAYNNRGNALYTIKQYEKAIEDYNKTIELDPENVIIYSNRGLAYSGLKRYGKAIEDYNKAIEFAPEDAYSYIYLSKINIFTGNYDSALAVITKVLSLPIKKEKKALALYIECVVKKLLGMDTSLPEREFNETIKNDFTIWWDFNKFDSWLNNADIDDETETFIKEKSNLLRTHLEE